LKARLVVDDHFPIRARPGGLLAGLGRWCQRPQRRGQARHLAPRVAGAWKALAVALIALGVGMVPREPGGCVVQLLVLIGVLNVPQIRGVPPAVWVGAVLSLSHLAFGTACLLASWLTFGGLFDDRDNPGRADQDVGERDRGI
jgi:hypothetical protein